MNLPIWLRVVIGLALVSYIAWRVHRRWQAAGS